MTVHFQAKVTEKARLTSSILSLRFNKTDGKPLTFEPGEYLMLHLENNKKPLVRPFSIASVPAKNASFEILIRCGFGGYASTLLEKTSIEEEYTFSGPYSGPPLATGDTPLTFIAFGAGIAPFRSMITHLLQKKNTSLITLIFFGSNADIEFIKKEFEFLSSKHENFSYYTHLVSKSIDAQDPHIQASHVETLALKGNEHIYICGTRAFMDEAAKLCQGQGIPAEHIYY